MKRTVFILGYFGLMLGIASCGDGNGGRSLAPTTKNKNKSSTTGWRFNDPKWGGFERVEYKEQETGPGLVFIEGGTVTLGSTEGDLTLERNNMERRVTVPSFYMDETEVKNIQYLEYLYWLNRVYVDYPEVYNKMLPDTLVWLDKLAYNEPYMRYYLRHPAYQDYPVVGVSWVQATAFASWRTDRVNEYILKREHFIALDPTKDQNENNFNTESYLVGQYEPTVKKKLPDYTPGGNKEGRNVRVEDGIFLPEYRLPTEAEWEYAAYGYSSQSFNENIDFKKIYPWQGLTARNTYTEKEKGRFMDNMKRGRGDQAGVSGKLNDNAFITERVDKGYPNDFGLYHMGGNVSEWVMDVYRPLTFDDVTDFNSHRGNVFQTKVTNSDGEIEEKDSLGRLKYRDYKTEELSKRRNFRTSDNIGDKDPLSDATKELAYEYSINSLIDNKVRVYKGASWNDRIYWASPGTRRYLDQELALSTLGFRCAMVRVGDPFEKK